MEQVRQVRVGQRVSVLRCPGLSSRRSVCPVVEVRESGLVLMRMEREFHSFERLVELGCEVVS